MRVSIDSARAIGDVINNATVAAPASIHEVVMTSLRWRSLDRSLSAIGFLAGE
jgi:hypothetical protein